MLGCADAGGGIPPGAEFHESVFELVPADDAAAEVLGRSALLRSFEYSLDAGRRLGRNFNAAKLFKRWMTEAGFVDVVERVPILSFPFPLLSSPSSSTLPSHTLPTHSTCSV